MVMAMAMPRNKKPTGARPQEHLLCIGHVRLAIANRFGGHRGRWISDRVTETENGASSLGLGLYRAQR